MQWLTAAKSAGMQGGIAVIKHHDGFCLWPTSTTKHNVTSSSNANAKETNVPRDFAAAVKKLGMKYGFYISPWDRNSPYWAEKDDDGNYTSTYTNDVFFKQCAEAATYGDDQFEMWFDGARGGSGHYGGKGGKRIVPLNGNTASSYDAGVKAKAVRITINDAKACPLLHTVSIY